MPGALLRRLRSFVREEAGLLPAADAAVLGSLSAACDASLLAAGCWPSLAGRLGPLLDFLLLDLRGAMLTAAARCRVQPAGCVPSELGVHCDAAGMLAAAAEASVRALLDQAVYWLKSLKCFGWLYVQYTAGMGS